MFKPKFEANWSQPKASLFKIEDELSKMKQTVKLDFEESSSWSKAKSNLEFEIFASFLVSDHHQSGLTWRRADSKDEQTYLSPNNETMLDTFSISDRSRSGTLLPELLASLVSLQIRLDFGLNTSLGSIVWISVVLASDASLDNYGYFSTYTKAIWTLNKANWIINTFKPNSSL